MLAFVGEANEGRLSDGVFAASRAGPGMRLGVLGVGASSTGTDFVGDTLRRLGGVRCIDAVKVVYLCSMLFRRGCTSNRDVGMPGASLKGLY